METYEERQADPSLAAWLREQTGGDSGRPAPPPVVPMPLLGAGDGPPEAHGRRRLLVFAAVPWAIALALGVLSVSRAGEAPGPPPHPAESAPPADPAPATADPAAAPVEPVEPATVDPSPGPGAAGDVAALLVRAALSAPAQGATTARYVDDVVATDVEAVGDLTVVTVLAVVLEGGERGWERASVERYGIAVRAGAAVAGPWLLPAAGAVAAHEVSPVEDAGLGERAAAALAAAGYRDVAAVVLARDPALPGVLRARFQAGAPGSPERVERTALLRDAPEPSVLGAAEL